MTDRGKPPSRVLLVLAGMMTQLLGVGCLIATLASLPIVHDLHHGMQALVASGLAAVAAIVCGTLVWRGRLVPLALAIGIDVGFGIVLPGGGSALGAMLKILPADDARTADMVVTAAAIAMFVAAVLCVLSIPSALGLRRWAREEIAAGRAPVAARTLPGMGRPSVRQQTMMIRVAEKQARSRPAVIAAVALTLIVIGVVVIAAAVGSGDGTSDLGLRTSGRDAGVDSRRVASGSSSELRAPKPEVPPPDAGVQSLEDVMATWHQAIAKATPAELAALFDDKAFAFGVEAHELAEGPAAIAAMIARDAGEHRDTTVQYSQLAHDGDVGWVAEELRVGSHVFVVSAVAHLDGTKWTIAALQWATALPNADAYREARDGSLPVPDAIPDAHDASPLADAMRTAFASKPSFVAARS
ncbi:MAG TPA: nuclear transport factor 2 family protein, partial [Kofleriaceae bacterium]